MPSSRRSSVDRALSVIERGGNALPHPVTLFAGMAAAVVVVSAIVAGLGVTVTHPGTGKPIAPVNLLTIQGLHRILAALDDFRNWLIREAA